MKRKLLILSCLLSVIFGCDDSPRANFSPDGRPYYPIEEGRYVIYNIEKIDYRQITTNDTAKYQMREVLAAKTTDADGKMSFRIEQFIRFDATQEWSLDAIWSVRIDESRIIRNELGISYIKMPLPLTEGLVWNGNALNGRNEDTYEVKGIEKPFAVFDQNYTSTATVLQHDSKDLVGRDYRIEIYGKEIGMIYKRTEVYGFFQDIETGLIIPDSIVSGGFWEQYAIDWGVE